MIFGSMMLDVTETRIPWILAVIVDGAMTTVHLVRESLYGVMLQVMLFCNPCIIMLASPTEQGCRFWGVEGVD